MTERFFYLKESQLQNIREILREFKTVIESFEEQLNLLESMQEVHVIE